MFGKKKSKPTPASGARPRNNDLTNLMGIGSPPMDDSDDEEGLLAELAALEGKPPPSKNSKPKKALVSLAEIDRMAAAGMKDVDDEDDDDDDYDENELLAELNDMSGSEDDDDGDDKASVTQQVPDTSVTKLLLERKEMYSVAIKNAKAEGLTSKVGRFSRGLKEVETMIKKVEAGGKINEDDIPPPVVVKITSKPIDHNNQTLPPATTPLIPETPIQSITTPPRPKPAERPIQSDEQHKPVAPRPEAPARPGVTPVVESTSPSSEKLAVLMDRQKKYKIAALKMKQSGNIEDARKYLGISKQFDTVIEALNSGKDVDLSQMPAEPDLTQQHTPSPPVQPPKAASSLVDKPSPANESGGAAAASTGPPAAPSTMLEALQQRFEKYEEACKKSQEEGNGSKARRMGRIVKQYQDAIKACKLKKPFDYNELPTPPGYGPIPGLASPAQDQPAAEAQPTTSVQQATRVAPTPATTPKAAAPTRNEKEYEFLVNRQKEFKLAALEAKKKGDVESAREYLRQCKGFDEMIIAAQNGMRVDVTTVPSVKRKAPVDVEENTERVHTAPKRNVEFQGSVKDQYKQIETALRKQIETSESNAKHYKLLGNLEAAKNFEALLKSSKTDLNTLLNYQKQASPVPNCQYVMKSFPVVRSNPQLSDSELSLKIVRCVNIPLPEGYQPKDMSVYVTYELPLPADKPQTGYTTTKKDTVNPEFDEEFKLSIDRKDRSFARFCKRQSVNVKVYYLKGFFRTGKALGQASIKMEKFSNRCEIHECIDLMDLEKGRKSVGGKIEVLLQIREAIVDKDAEIVKEKWLVLDTHLRGLEMKTSHQTQPKPTATATYESLEVLKQEKERYQNQFSAIKAQGKQPPSSIAEKIQSHQQRIEVIAQKLKQGGKPALNDYRTNLLKGMEIEKMKAQNALKSGDKDAARTCLSRKKLLEKEIGVLNQALSS